MNELRALACLVKHKAHIVRWRGYDSKENGGWKYSKCIWCGATPEWLEDNNSFPFYNTDGTGVYRITEAVKTGKARTRQFRLSYLKRFGLTWPQVRDAK